jgi:glycerophosphoryl diester phosphodiesterase
MAKMKQMPKPKLNPKSQPPKTSFWPKSGIAAIAHRGGDAAGNEQRNTLGAFQTAWDLGYEYAETDVILAASGELAVIHGSLFWLQAAFNRDITRSVLQKMTLEQIRHALKPGGAQIPTLEEVLTTFPKVKFFIDLKTDEVVEPLAKLVGRLEAFERVCIVGLDYGRNLEFKRLCRPAKARIGLTIGRGVRVKNINMLLLKTGRLSDVDAILMHHSLVSRPMINLVHRRGLKAIIWTANSKIGIKHALRSGADGIISDRIKLLREVIDFKK